MLIKPLIMRELLRECRRGSYFLRRTIFVLILSGIVTFQWLFTRGMARNLSPQAAAAATGGALFAIWAQAQFLAVCFFSMVRAASLADERRIGSLPLMRTTALGDGGIVFGWFLSVMGRAFFTMTLTLPILFMSRGFGGFTLNQALSIALFTLIVAAEVSALTLWLASRSASSGGVVMGVAVLMLLWVGAGANLLPGFRLRGLFRETAWLNAGSMLMNYVRKGPTWSHPQNYLGPYGALTFVVSVGARLIAAAFMLRMTAVSLKRGPVRATHGLRSFLSGIGQFFLNLTSGTLVIWRPKLGVCKGNPVLWRERAVSVLSRPDHVIRIAYLALILLILATVPVGLATRGHFAIAFLVAGLVTIPCLLIFAATVVPPATAFSKERQQKTLPTLAVTPLTAHDIMRGKYGFAMRRMLVPLVIMFLIVAMVGYASNGREGRIITPMLCCIALVPLAVALVLFVCAGAESSGKAIIAALAVLGLCVFPVILGLAGGWEDVLDRRMIERTPPLAAYFLAAGAMSRRRRWLAHPLAVTAGVLALLGLIGAGLGNVPAARLMPFLAGAVYLAVSVVGRFSRPGRWGYMVLAPVVIGAAFLDRGAAWLVLSGSALFGLISVIPRAPKGVFARGALALAIIAAAAVLTEGIGKSLLGYRYYRTVSFAVIYGALALGLTLAFLRATTRQLDELIGRNG